MHPGFGHARRPHRRGRGSGHAALAAPLRHFLDDGLARLNHLLPEPVSLAGLQSAISTYRTAIAAATPDLASEIAGLADGAGLSLDEAALLQLRREHGLPEAAGQG